MEVLGFITMSDTLRHIRQRGCLKSESRESEFPPTEELNASDTQITTSIFKNIDTKS